MTLNNVTERLTRWAGDSIYIYRQALATFAASLLSLAGGITFGYSAVLLPQLEQDKDFPYDKSYDSWIASISPLTMMLGCFFSGTMSDGLGRKTGQLILIIPYSISWIILAFANNNTIVLVARGLNGICTGAVRALNSVYIGELSTPKYRGVTLFCPSMAIHIGSFMSHTVGKYLYWRTSCYMFLLPNVVCVLILLFLKESPLWLMTKGREKEGIESFKFFRGEDEDSNKELDLVLEKTREKSDQSSFKELSSIFFSKPFMKSMLIIILLFIAVQWCGVNTLSFYSEDIYKKTFSGGVDAFMLMLATDILRIAASTVVCIVARYLPRKLSFLICCYATTVTLIFFVIYLYLKPVGLVPLGVTLIVIYISISSVLTCISWSFIAEIFPSKIRGFGSGLSSGITFILLFSSVKVSPSIMENFGEAAMFGVFGVVTFVAAVFLNFILPETNGKSLQEIENSMYHKKTAVDAPTSQTEPRPIV